MTAVDVLASVALLAGALLSLVAGVGLIRFPDVLARLHAASKPQVLGLLLILVGAGLRLRSSEHLTTLLLVGVFQMATVPVAAQMIGRAAHRSGRFRPDLLVSDELTGGPMPGAQPEPPPGTR